LTLSISAPNDVALMCEEKEVPTLVAATGKVLAGSFPSASLGGLLSVPAAPDPRPCAQVHGFDPGPFHFAPRAGFDDLHSFAPDPGRFLVGRASSMLPVHRCVAGAT
jgi:hypothetical protein